MANKNQITLLITAALMTALVAGCGAGGSSSSSGSSTSASADSTGTTASSSEGAAGFDTQSKLATFGQEADPADREAASSVLEENLQAREAGEWAVQCASLSAAALKGVEESPAASPGRGCVKNLQAQAEPLPESKPARVNTMIEPIAALRIKGNEAYALYHGANGADFAIPMDKEGGEWKVAALITQQLR
jgi:hypothetical protein